MTMKRIIPLILVAGVALCGCSGMNDTQQRTLTGAAGGAVAGTVVGAIAGNAGLGAVIGTGVGAAGGYIYDKHKKAEQHSYDQGYADASKKKKSQ
jgi:uncharacterized protein YcfJ